ncbi:uncharacterized protein LOC144911407 isoform X2 [Branchiostoma floridae x Branchiostoma belcheri]
MPRPSDALQPNHRPDGPSGRTAAACIVTHHRDLRCPGPTIGLQVPQPGRLTPSSLTTGRRGHPPSASRLGLPSGCPRPNHRRSLTTGWGGPRPSKRYIFRSCLVGNVTP